MTIEHTPGCIFSKAITGKDEFTPNCPLCRLQKAAPQLLAACKSLITAVPVEIRAHVGETPTTDDHCAIMVNALRKAEAAIAAAEKE